MFVQFWHYLDVHNSRAVIQVVCRYIYHSRTKAAVASFISCYGRVAAHGIYFQYIWAGSSPQILTMYEIVLKLSNAIQYMHMYIHLPFMNKYRILRLPLYVWNYIEAASTLRKLFRPLPSFLRSNTQTMHIKSFVHDSIAIIPLKLYTLAVFESGDFCSWGWCDVHCTTPTGPNKKAIWPFGWVNLTKS
jgi:hypothetical protein